MTVRSFRDLQIWQRSLSLVEDIYRVTKTFPKQELYGLTDQVRRSAVSIPSNIAEGFARGHKTEYRQFLYIALGSCAELVTQITIAGRISYLEPRLASDLLDEIDQISKMIMSLVKKLV